MTSGLLGRIGEWCFRKKWIVAGIWIVVFGVGTVVTGSVIPEQLADQASAMSSEAGQGKEFVERAANSSDEIIGLVDNIDREAPAVQATVLGAADELAKRGDVLRVTTPYADGLSPEERTPTSRRTSRPSSSWWC